jgi:hypothetical protein
MKKLLTFSALALGAASLASGQILVYHYNFNANNGTGSTVNDVSGFGTPANGTLRTGNPNNTADLFANTTPSPDGGFYGNFTAQRSNLQFDQSKYNSEIAGINGSGAFTVTMMLRDLTVTTVDRRPYDRAFFGERFRSQGGGSVALGLGNDNETNNPAATHLALTLNGSDYTFANTVDLSNATTGDSNGWILLAMTFSVADDTARVFVGREFNAGTGWNITEVASQTVADSSGVLTTAGRELLFAGSTHLSNPLANYDDFRLYDGVLSASELAAIPEPSTYAALFGLLAIGFVAWRRRRRA